MTTNNNLLNASELKRVSAPIKNPKQKDDSDVVRSHSQIVTGNFRASTAMNNINRDLLGLGGINNNTSF